MCTHIICHHLHTQRKRCRGGLAIVPFILAQQTPYIILGHEDQYECSPIRICTGKMSEEDADCYIACAVREFSEEYKLTFTIEEFMSRCTSKVVCINRCPVFTLDVTDHTIGPWVTRRKIDQLVRQSFSQTSLPNCLRELSKTYCVPITYFDSVSPQPRCAQFVHDIIRASIFGIKSPTWSTVSFVMCDPCTHSQISNESINPF